MGERAHLFFYKIVNGFKANRLQFYSVGSPRAPFEGQGEKGRG